MKQLTKRDLMILINSLALYTDDLSKHGGGSMPNSKSFDATYLQAAYKFCEEEFNKQPYASFNELNDLFVQLVYGAIKELSEEDAALLSLPPSEYIH